jgi:VWFA-related protein
MTSRLPILARTSFFGKRQVILILAAFFGAVTILSAAQENPPRTIQRFVARTELVTVPVIVLNHGKHVTGLHKADFEVDEEGRPKSIATFEEVGLAQSAKPVAAPAGIYTNEIIADGPVTMTVILLDLINTPYLYQQPVKRRLLEYLQHSYRADRPTMLAVLHRDGLHVLHDFTNDPKALENRLRNLKNDIKHDTKADDFVQNDSNDTLLKQIDVASEYDALAKEFFEDLKPQERYKKHVADDDLETTFIELQQLARALASVRGMKSMIWASAGVQLPPTIGTRSSRVREEFEQTLRLMNAADIVVTPVDTYLETDNPGFSAAMYQLPATGTGQLPLPGKVQIVQNFMEIAQRTGGTYCLLRRDHDCFEKMADFTSHYYLLSYYAQPSEKSVWRKLRVDVHGEKLEVLARNGYFSIGAAGNPEERRRREIEEAFRAPVEYRGLPISARWENSRAVPPVATEKPGRLNASQVEIRRKRSFQLGIAPGTLAVDEADHNHIQLDIIVVAIDSKGSVLKNLSQQLDLHPTAEALTRLRDQGLLYANSMEVPEATAKLRFVVRDDLNENLGTVSMPVGKPASK